MSAVRPRLPRWRPPGLDRARRPRAACRNDRTPSRPAGAFGRAPAGRPSARGSWPGPYRAGSRASHPRPPDRAGPAPAPRSTERFRPHRTGCRQPGQRHSGRCPEPGRRAAGPRAGQPRRRRAARARVTRSCGAHRPSSGGGRGAQVAQGRPPRERIPDVAAERTRRGPEGCRSTSAGLRRRG